MTFSNSPPVIGITMGDPAGIGPEIIIKTLSRPGVSQKCRPVVIGDRAILEKALSLTKSPMGLVSIPHPDQYSGQKGAIHLIETSDLAPDSTLLTSPTPETGRAMEAYITTGVDLALEGAIEGLVTGPITKTGLKMAGSPFHGHTELIASRTGTANFAMMLAGTRLKVVLVTIHMPLSRVAGSLTPDEVVRVIRLTHEALRTRFGISEPRLAAAGLNPHAGEEGLFGQEETEIIRPALIRAREKGVSIDGPLPPDTVFYHAVKGRYDAVVCMYHDQGLIPFKLVHFEDGVNTTLGLPIIRTSVDHGTAYDIAWKGIASPDSMEAALDMAVLQAQNRRKHTHAG